MSRSTSPVILKRRAVAVAPLSFNQRQLWFLDRVMPANAAYNIPTSLRIPGELDVDALGRALNAVVRRHGVLRTRFAESEGEPVQVIEGALEVVIEREDLASIPSADRERVLEDRLKEEGRRGFDLERLPLLRARVLQLGINEQVFFLVLHHIIADGWSLPILFQELETFYEAYRHGKEVCLPELPLQYADYAVRQKQEHERGGFEADLNYWRKELDDAPEVLELPADYPRSENQTFDGAGEQFTLGGAIVDGLKRLGHRAGASFYMTVLACYAALLHRYSGQEEVLIGVPAANRESEQLQGLIGFFVNMLVMRVNLEGNPSFLDLLQRVREAALQAYDHQKLPFELLVAELKPERNLKRNPLFQAAFSLINEEVAAGRPAGSWPRYEELNNSTFKFDLGTVVFQSRSNCLINIGYNPGIFRRETCIRLKRHFQELLDRIVAHPEAGISIVPILLPEEEKIARDWRQVRTDYPRRKRIEQIFESQVEKSSHALALLYPSVTLSYQHLNDDADRIARYLRKSGVGAEAVVGVCMERCWQAVVAMLGILKAGAACLPLDTSCPPARLQFMVEDSGASVVLTEDPLPVSLTSRLPDHCRVICYDDVPDVGGHLPATNASPENLAYVIYSSGVSQKPKGIAICHSSVTRLVCTTNYVELGAGDRIAHISSLSCAPAIFEIWGALLNGGCLVGLTAEESLNPTLLAHRIKNDAVTTMFLTTALFNRVAASQEADALGDLRYLLFGGETADPKWVNEILRYSTPQHMLHVYGLSENTAFSLWHPIPVVQPTSTTVPIGGPVANTEAYVLDANLTPVPTGVIGELFLAADGLARGYINLPGLTAEKFVPNPFSVGRSDRLFRTGDLVKYTPKGAIELIGRTDQVIKIGGCHVLPAEMEMVLRLHPNVRECAVFVEENSGEKQLFAYVIADHGIASEELRGYLTERLPNHMAAAKLVVVPEWPLTENGKIDRVKLLEQAQVEHGGQKNSQWIAPRTDLEEAIASIWGEILRVERIGVHDNIFDLGGHSLLLMQIHGRMRKQLREHASIKVTDLFVYPTINSLAQFLVHRASAVALA